MGPAVGLTQSTRMAKKHELGRLRNARVVDIHGERLGKIGEIFLNDRAQHISYVTVSLGWLRSREVYVPYSLMAVTDNAVIVQVPKAMVERAPRANGTGYLTEAQERDLDAFYAPAL